MASQVQLDLDHSKMQQGFHEGMEMPQIYEPIADHLPKIKKMELRDDDVLLCTYPKSGTHWLYRIIDMLQRGHAIYDKRTADSTFLDLQKIERMKDLDSPRLLVSHLPYDRLPTQARDKKIKIVHMYRNPRAVLVSFHFQMASLKPEEKEEWSLLKMAEKMFTGKLPYTGWFKYMDKLNAFLDQNPNQPIFNISYEEMTEDPVKTVEKLATFLGTPRSPELYSAIVDACSFKKQKDTEEKADPIQGILKFYRKGDKDDWKNHMSVALSERFDKELEGRTRCRFSKKYLPAKY